MRLTRPNLTEVPQPSRVTGWINNKRAKRKADNRRRHHEALIEAAPTVRQKVWAACGWLVSEAGHANRLDDAFEAVMSKVHEIREEEQADDRDNYAA